MATNNKYDRQIRLWGSFGQHRLLESKIVIINLTPSNGEVLKNLTLAGIHSFDIIDHKTVDESDVGSNLMLGQASIGKSRAEVFSAAMLDMNPDIQDHACHQFDPYSTHNEAVLKNLISTSNLVVIDENDTDKFNLILSYCNIYQIKLVRLQVFGQIAKMRVYAGNHFVFYQPLDRDWDDYRLSNPFPALEQYLKSFDFQNPKNEYEHYHTPYIAIIYQALQEYIKQNPDFDTNNFSQRTKFKKFVESYDKMKNYDSNENFQQASKWYYKALDEFKLDDSINGNKFIELLPSCTNMYDRMFIIGILSLGEFKQMQGRFPVTNKISDMKASTNNYVTLKNIYRQQFQDDLVTFKRIYFSNVDKHDNGSKIKEFRLIDEYLNDLMKNLRMLKYINYLNYTPQDTNGSLMNVFYGSGAESLFVTIACEILEKSRSDNSNIRKYAEEYVKEHEVENFGAEVDYDKIEDYVKDMLLFDGHTQLASIAGIVGGVASQEAVKLITGVFTPLDNTFIFNGIFSSSASLKMD